jgi:hypothetical protein
LGTVAIILFIGLRALSLYGDPRPWKPAPRPPSRPRNCPVHRHRLQRKLPAHLPQTVLPLPQPVPLFYYVLHIPLIHIAALLVSLIRIGTMTGWLFTNHPVR